MGISQYLKNLGKNKPLLLNIVIAVLIVTVILIVLESFLPSNYLLTVVYLICALVYSVMARLFFDLKRYKFSLAFLLQVYIWARAGIVRSIIDGVGVASHLSTADRILNESFLTDIRFSYLTSFVTLLSITLLFFGILDLLKTYKESKNDITI